jgi:hypothetical protein
MYYLFVLFYFVIINYDIFQLNVEVLITGDGFLIIECDDREDCEAVDLLVGFIRILFVGIFLREWINVRVIVFLGFKINFITTFYSSLKP